MILIDGVFEAINKLKMEISVLGSYAASRIFDSCSLLQISSKCSCFCLGMDIFLLSISFVDYTSNGLFSIDYR